MASQHDDEVTSQGQLPLFAQQENDTGVVLGRPIEPEEATRMELEVAWQALGSCYVATKFDGFRLQIQRSGDRIWLFTRNGQDWTERFPTIADAATRQILADRVILDAELIAVDPTSQLILPRSKIVEMGNQLFRAIVFDVLYVSGHNVQGKSLQERMQNLRALISQEPSAVLVPAEETLVNTLDELKRLYDECVNSGNEGLILKSPISQYHSGERNRLRVKVKVTDSIDAVVLGFDLRNGQASPEAITTLLVGVYDQKDLSFVSMAKVGKGKLASDQWQELCNSLYQQRRQLKGDNVVAIKKPMWWVLPKTVVELEGYGREVSRHYAAGRTQDGVGYQLVGARIATGGIRHDKNPEHATTLEQFMRMRLGPGHTDHQNEADDQMRLL